MRAKPGESSRKACQKLERKSRLDDNDIARILEKIGNGFCELDAAKREELKRNINDNLRVWTMFRDWRITHTPHKSIAGVQKAQLKLVAALEAVLPLARDLAYAADWISGNPCSKEIASLETLQSEVPALSEAKLVLVQKVQKAGVVLPSGEAKALVASYLLSLDQLHSLARGIEMLELRRQKVLGANRKQSKKIDQTRYGFIASTAEVYEGIFGRPPTSTRDGPWCGFLAAVLTCVEGNELLTDSAYDLWRKVKGWKDRLQG
jgi:hypothetical protein